jgi:hypothetical protein
MPAPTKTQKAHSKARSPWLGFAFAAAIFVVTCVASSAWAQNEVDLSRLDAQARKQVQAACYFHKLEGVTVYAKCLKRQIAKLDPTAARVGSPATAQNSALPNPRWNESGLTTSASWGGRPTAANIFKAVEQSVYIVLAAATGEDLEAERNVSQGSAVAISKTLVLTNCHVLKDKPVIVLVTADGFLPAKRQAIDVEKDSCVLQVAGGLRAIPALRRYRSLEVGERVYTVGSGIEGAVDLDMVVGMDLGGFPLGVFEGRRRQGCQALRESEAQDRPCILRGRSSRLLPSRHVLSRQKPRGSCQSGAPDVRLSDRPATLSGIFRNHCPRLSEITVPDFP